ncbi:DUF6922 domain-containing protein [Chryseobacterium scophthalmum]|uniref:DUF6922 domain-containing protein n=1 Tax=Chryseobacterium scophthalmum TaxID=59733 RepID=UPI003D015749
MTILHSNKTIIFRIVERGGQEEMDEIIHFYGREKVINTISNEIYFLTDFAIDRAIAFFPFLTKEELYCYFNRKDKPYHWI